MRGYQESFAVEAIEEMVHEFYGRIQEDEVLGPIFDRRIDDWPEHLERMVRFWRAVLRSEPLFKPGPRGGPPILHRQIEELERHHFGRWLGLFEEVVVGIYPEDEAYYVVSCAHRIAGALSSHLP